MSDLGAIRRRLEEHFTTPTPEQVKELRRDLADLIREVERLREALADIADKGRIATEALEETE